MPTTTESGPVPTRARRRCRSWSRHKNSHAKWTGHRGLDNTSATIAGSAVSFGYNAANELTSRGGSGTGWSYDGNGNETAGVGVTTRSSEVWNSHDQLTSATVSGTATAFTYTGLGQDTRLTSGGHSIRNGPLGITKDSTTSLTQEIVRDPRGVLIANRQGASTYYYLFDGLGSVVALVNTSGAAVKTYKYDPYGIDRAQTGTVANPFQYTGGYIDGDSTKLYKFGARYYDPTLGRFTSTDPAHQEANAFAYAKNSPTSFVDPAGTDTFGISGGVCAVVCLNFSLGTDGLNGTGGCCGIGGQAAGVYYSPDNVDDNDSDVSKCGGIGYIVNVSYCENEYSGDSTYGLGLGGGIFYGDFSPL